MSGGHNSELFGCMGGATRTAILNFFNNIQGAGHEAVLYGPA